MKLWKPNVMNFLEFSARSNSLKTPVVTGVFLYKLISMKPLSQHMKESFDSMEIVDETKA